MEQYQQLLYDKVDSAFKARREQSPEGLKTVEPTYKAPAAAEKKPAPAATDKTPLGGEYPTLKTPKGRRLD
jgi:hypothetical protein